MIMNTRGKEIKLGLFGPEIHFNLQQLQLHKLETKPSRFFE